VTGEHARYWDTLALHALELGNGWASSVASGSYILTRVEPQFPRLGWLRASWRRHWRSLWGDE
jgi:hypothetical protein